MRVAYIADIDDNHVAKWISEVAKRHEVILISDPRDNHQINLYSDSPKVSIYEILPKEFPLRDFRSRKKVLKHIKSIFEKHQIQILHSIYVFHFSFWAVLLGFRRHIITTFGSDVLVSYPELNRPKGLKQGIVYFLLKNIIKRSFQRALYITSTSNSQMDVVKEVLKVHTDVEKIQLVRTGVLTQDFLNLYNALPEKNSEEYVILSVRAMTPLYNIDIIIDAFDLLLKSNPEVKPKLLLINYSTNWDYYKFIVEKINKLRLNSFVEILQDQPYADLVSLYKRSDVVVMIPKSDGTPVTGIESQLARRPLILGNLEYDKDLFNSHSTWKLNSLTAEDLANSLAQIYYLSPTEKKTKLNYAFEQALVIGDTYNELARIEKLYCKMLH